MNAEQSTTNPSMENTPDPDRETVDVIADEFSERYRRGEYPSVTEYVDRYPAQATELRELLPAVVMMEQLKQKEESQLDSLERRSIISGLKQLGDFRIIREIGHGGMGVVYEAEQESLGRHVALKVLSPASFSSEKVVTRFKREAETVARLHHTNIVPIFGVGEEKGLHYYVMQLISGDPLDSVISGLRAAGSVPTTQAPHETLAETIDRPKVANLDNESSTNETPSSTDSRENVDPTTNIIGVPQTEAAETFAEPADREPKVAEDVGRLASLLKTDSHWDSVAAIGVQVARALAYAHQHGVCHRDIKPSNLLIDETGMVWLVDFGLARLAEENELTQTGDLLGTLRYMSPEQVVGQFDHRSDVYSLGLTLYELLTFRPAHDASIRSRIMQQINEAQPNPPRSINPDIPLDLETIILKATAHDPADRYQSATDLAGDLQRYIDGFPIKARRVGPLEQLTRWRRRNPALAASMSMTLILLVAVASLSTWGLLTAREANQQLEAEQEKTLTEALRAESNLTRALQAFEKIVDRVASRGIAQSVQADILDEDDTVSSAPLTEADAELLKGLLEFYKEFAQDNAGSAQLAVQTAKAQRRIGDIYQQLRQYDQAIAAYSDSRRMYEQLSAIELAALDDPTATLDSESLAATVALADVRNQIGIVESHRKNMPAAAFAHSKTVQFLDSLDPRARGTTEVRFLLAQTLNWLGSMKDRIDEGVGSPGGNTGGPGAGFGKQHGGRPGNSEQWKRDGDQDERHRDDGNVDRRADKGPFRGGPDHGRRDEFRKRFESISQQREQSGRRALEILTALVAEQPGNKAFRLELARAHKNGICSPWPFGESQDSTNRLANLKSAVAILEKLSEEDPEKALYQYELADTLALSCRELEENESWDDTAARVERSVAISRELVATHSGVPQYAVLLAATLRKLSGIQNRGGDQAASRESITEAASLLRDVIGRSPKIVVYRVALARILNQAAMLEAQTANYETGLGHLSEATQSLEEIEHSGADSRHIGSTPALLAFSEFRLLAQAGRKEEAEKARKKAESLDPKWRFGHDERELEWLRREFDWLRGRFGSDRRRGGPGFDGRSGRGRHRNPGSKDEGRKPPPPPPRDDRKRD